MSLPLIATTLVRAAHARSFLISLAKLGGWEVTAYEDQRIVHQCLYHDWHHVEVALARFSTEIARLRLQGWQEP
jgi:hypothetical protein